jgi:hypothetical protein
MTSEALDSYYYWTPPGAVCSEIGGLEVIEYNALGPWPEFRPCLWSTLTANEAVGTGAIVGHRPGDWDYIYGTEEKLTSRSAWDRAKQSAKIALYRVSIEVL